MVTSGQQRIHEVTPDEPRTAGDERTHGGSLASRLENGTIGTLMDNWRQDGGLRTRPTGDRPRSPVRRAVWTGIAIAAVGFGVYALMHWSGIVQPDLTVVLVSADTTDEGELRTEWDIFNDGDFDARIERIIVSDAALGFGDVTATDAGGIVDLATTLEEGEHLQVEIIFDGYDCNVIASASKEAPKVEIRATGLAPWATKSSYAVVPATSLQVLADRENTDWLTVATADLCDTAN